LLACMAQSLAPLSCSGVALMPRRPQSVAPPPEACCSFSSAGSADFAVEEAAGFEEAAALGEVAGLVGLSQPVRQQRENRKAAANVHVRFMR